MSNLGLLKLRTDLKLSTPSDMFPMASQWVGLYSLIPECTGLSPGIPFLALSGVASHPVSILNLPIGTFKRSSVNPKLPTPSPCKIT